MTTTDATLRDWLRAAPDAARTSILERLGGRLAEWTTEMRKEAGFALATWRRLHGPDVERWFWGYRRVLGNIVTWDVEARAAYWAPQLAAASEETVRVWASDRSDGNQTGSPDPIPTVFRAFREERVAMEQAARGIAAARELESRRRGITKGPPEDGAAPGNALAAIVAVQRCGRDFDWLRGREPAVRRHVESIVAALDATDGDSMKALLDRVSGVIPSAVRATASGRFPISSDVRHWLRLEQRQRIEAEEYIRRMGTAGKLRWSSRGAGDATRSRTEADCILGDAQRNWQTVLSVETELATFTGQGRTAPLWLGSEAFDHQTRAFACYVAGQEIVREQGRSEQIPPPQEMGFDL